MLQKLLNLVKCVCVFQYTCDILFKLYICSMCYYSKFILVGGFKKKSTAQPCPHTNQYAWIREHPGSNHSQSLMACNFAALWPTDPKFSALKDLNPFKTVYKIQEASSILKVGFAQ